jgi:hypothetical protein
VRLLDSLRAAKSVDVIDPAGKESDSLSVEGAAAALLYMDDRQHRLGTRGALVRRGETPDTSVPQPPALPIRDSVHGSPKPPARVSAAFIAKVRKDNDCADEKDPNQVSVDRLDATHTFVSITLLCQSGAYNFISDNYVITNGGTAPQPARFDDDKPRNDGDLDHYNLYWDAKTRILDAGFKGRGIGDCGGRQHYAWDGMQFRLVGVETMDDCRGVVDFISVWRAQVVER